MASYVRKGKRKYVERSENRGSPVNLSPQKIAQSPRSSPRSSPIKSPLLDGNGTGSQSFVAKCFYGLKKSAKQDLASPPRKLRQFKPEQDELKILRDPSLNKKLLERIAQSPVKQAVLQSCSLEEFRKVYRDEIKEVELEAELSNHRLTRASSKIVYRRNNSEEDDESDDDCMSFVDEEVSFKTPNRGFDIDSISDCSSSKVQSPVSLKDKSIVDERNSAYSNKWFDQNEDVDDVSSNCSGKERDDHQSPSQSKQVTCTTSTSGRKFFKTKSPHDSLAASARSVVLGKNFNLRFISRSHDKESKSQKRKKAGMTVFKPRRLSLGDSIATSTLVLSNQTNFNKSVMIPTPKTGNSFFSEDDDVENNIKQRASKTCITLNQYQSNEADDMADISSSLPESDQIDAGPSTKRGSPTESILSLNDRNETVAESPTKDTNGTSDQRLFPIFTSEKSSGIKKNDRKSSPRSTNSLMKKAVNDSQSQMIIDAGQKRFGATQCSVCGMVYSHADPMDEAAHSKFHNRLIAVLKFPGWKKGRDVQEFPIDCGVVVMVLAEDPKYCLKKVHEIYEIMARDLGFPGDEPFRNPYQKVFFYVSCEKRIEGCCVAERIWKSYRVIPGDLDSSSPSGRRPWCCSTKAEPAILGISRLWVSASSRRSGVATRLVDSVRQWFDYGNLIRKDAVAMSDPTPDGRKFAEKYFGTPAFLIYKYNI